MPFLDQVFNHIEKIEALGTYSFVGFVILAQNSE